MNSILTRRFATTLFVISFIIPFAFAQAASLSVTSLKPGDAVRPNTEVTFTIEPSGFIAGGYTVADSFSGSTISQANIALGGKFRWVPSVSDVGTHTLTLSALDYAGASASVVQTITVLPKPSVTIQSVSSATNVMPGTNFTFKASTDGFTNPSFILGDSFSGSTITAANIDAAGNFSWKPDESQRGTHVITLYATDTQGHSAETAVTIVVGSMPGITLINVAPGTTLVRGQSLTFTATPTGYAPTGYSVTDSFPGSTVSNNNINVTGNFAWVPQESDAGTHVLRIAGTVGVFGQSASTTITVYVPDKNGYVAAAAQSTNAAAAGAATTSASGSTLSTLQAQLAALQAKIASSTGSASGGPSTVPGGYVFAKYLYAGMTGDEVLQLQNILVNEGFLSATPNGKYGPLTTAAVKKFQAARGLSPLGVVGPGTRAALNAILAGSAPAGTGASAPEVSSGEYTFENFIGRGQQGKDVSELQKKLAALGFFKGNVTGYFGGQTEAALKAFQEANGIDARGYVGPGTRKALNSK